MASKSSSTPTNVKAEAETSTMGEGVVVLLKSMDDEIFEVDTEVALMSEKIREILLEDVGVKDTIIPIPNVDSKTLARVIEYCKKHVHANAETHVSSDELSNWDKDFVKDDEYEALVDLILAANYLNISSLLDLGCQGVADIMEDLSVEEIRETFNIENDFTPEEEAAVREENAWAFEYDEA